MQYALAFTTNVTRPIICPGHPDCYVEPEFIDPNFPADRNHSWIFMMFILIPLFLSGALIPCIMIWLDKKDYGMINDNKVLEKEDEVKLIT
jgi:hypothetical protein